MPYPIILFIFSLYLLQGCNEKRTDSESFKIAIGSCYDTSLDDNGIWTSVLSTSPDIWVWLGDIVYADTHDMSIMKKKYDSLKYSHGYQNVLKSTNVTGIWDDHDYGRNDGGKYYTKKKESKEQLLNFLDVDKTDSVYSHEGIYRSYLYGRSNQKIKLILLDTRYFRDTLEVDTATNERYSPNPTGDILGEEQWVWLENELRKNEATIHIIASGYQIIAWEPGFEKWSNFPLARKRLFDLLVKTKPNKVFMLSGDRHISEISKLDLEGLGHPLYEFTSSGLTHTWEEERPEKNRHRVSELIIKKNFGLIIVEWENDQPKVTFEIRDHNNTLMNTYSPQL